MTSVQLEKHRPRGWTADPGFGVYVHIPFCRHRCHYCDFNTYEGKDELHGPYVDALVKHIGDRWTQNFVPPATSAFFGGGTPSLLPPADLRRILDAVRATVGIATEAEITVEVNPETVDERVLAELLEAGFNRLSIGVQSLAGPVLAALGREHTAGRALQAIAAARAAGFEDINADLIYGSPWESDEDWTTSIEGVVAAAPDHVSAYALTVEAGTPLATMVATGRAPDVDPDVQAARYEAAEVALANAGYMRYEVSNWARPGHECRHNLLYWSGGDYLGLGAGAHGHMRGRRYWSVRLPSEFIARASEGADTEAGHEQLSADERAGEALMLGLRLTDGIVERDFGRRYGTRQLAMRAPAIEDLIALGLLERAGGRLRIAPATTLLGDEVARRLL
jgi:putative oxygen-independent coproporphyrinogen III oxidase